MKNILEEIAARTRERIAKEKTCISVSEKENRIQEVKKKAMQKVTDAETIEVLVDNETAVQNVTKMAQSTGATVTQEKRGEDEYKVTIQALAGEGTQTAPAGAVCDCVPTGDTVVVISSDKMGSGNDELGKVLIKGCIFAITQLDELPKKMIFYNGGAQISCEGSDSLEDLKNLESQGVEIVTCGTCLDYYGMKDKLAVGTVTNMYDIVESMNNAGKIVKPCQKHRNSYSNLKM